MKSEFPIVFGFIERNSRERIRCAIEHYAGHTFLDLRIFAQLGDGESKPTKQGVTIRLHRLHDLRRLVDLAIEEADRLTESEPG
jgi:hypothetical protein